VHRELEERLAALKGTGAALLFSSGYHANLGIIASLAGPGDAVLSDERNHASIVDGCRLSRAEVLRYPHADVEALEQLLRRSRARRKLVVTDAVFSMEGDAAPLGPIADACARAGAMLHVDEAHSTGLFGPGGGGLAEELGLTERVDAIMGTLGKALGSFGAFAAGTPRLREFLICRARTFIFTTALPPAACGAALAALDVLRDEPGRRARLSSLQRRMRAGLETMGFPLPAVVAPIFPVVLGEERTALEASARLRQRGYFVKAIRPPTVAPGTSRLRVTLTAAHGEDQIDGFLEALGEVLGELGVR
jgi:8-amino-7-oxononanoate synthase